MLLFSKNNLLTIKHEKYVINLNDKRSRGTNSVSLFIDRNTVVYFDSFIIDYILQDVLSKIKDKSISRNICRRKDDDSIMWGFYYITFIEYMLVGKT